MDIGRYLRRIGLPATAPVATLDELRTLVWHHVTHVPFENVDVQLGQPIALDLPSLEDKLVVRCRGGYCFEQNALFATVLGDLGYDVTTLAARVRWNRVGPTPRTHMLLRVKLDDRDWLVDVGFGGFVPTEPLRMEHDVLQPGRLGTFRLVREGDFDVLQARTDDAWGDLYAFTDEPHTAIDYEVMNHYTSTHPASRFRTSLIVSQPAATERRAILNDELIVRGPGGVTRTKLERAQVPRMLRELFAIDVPDGTVFAALTGAPCQT